MASVITPYYREYELAWDGDTESDARFRKILRILLIVLLVLGILFFGVAHAEAHSGRNRSAAAPGRAS